MREVRDGDRISSYFIDYNAILEVPFNTTNEVIRDSFWVKAMVMHPDVGRSRSRLIQYEKNLIFYLILLLVLTMIVSVKLFPPTTTRLAMRS